jgi:hypothetical protein
VSKAWSLSRPEIEVHLQVWFGSVYGTKKEPPLSVPVLLVVPLLEAAAEPLLAGVGG